MSIATFDYREVESIQDLVGMWVNNFFRAQWKLVLVRRETDVIQHGLLETHPFCSMI